MAIDNREFDYLLQRIKTLENKVDELSGSVPRHDLDRIQCTRCYGRGYQNGYQGETYICGHCNGKGFKIVNYQGQPTL